MSQTRVAFVESRYRSFYGAQRSMFALVKNLPKDRIEPVVVVTGEGPLAEQCRKADVAVAVLPLRGKANTFGGEVARGSILEKLSVVAEILRYNLRIARWFQREGVRVVYVNDLRALLYVCVACKLTRLPLIWYVRSDGQPSLLSRMGLRVADRVILIAQGVRRTFGEAVYEKNRQKFVTLYTGFDVRGTSDERDLGAQIRREFSIPLEAEVLGIVSSITPRKGHDLLIEALSRIREERDVRLLIIGGVSPGYEGYRDRLVRRIHELGLSTYVYWAGYQEDVSSFYCAMDVVVLPSRSEGLPRTVVEALSFGLPVVATDVGGVREILTNDILGRVVPVENANALAEAITDILTAAEVRTRQAAEARISYVREKFSIDRYVTGFVAIVEEMTSEKHRSGG